MGGLIGIGARVVKIGAGAEVGTSKENVEERKITPIPFMNTRISHKETL